MTWLPPLAGLGGIVGAVGGWLIAPLPQLSDAQTATFGGIITALITTGGAVAIAYINRPSRTRGDDRDDAHLGEGSRPRRPQRNRSQGDTHDDT